MRFSIFAAAFMATAVIAESTVYTTEEVTITSCAATVTNCPARSTVTSITSYPVVTTSSAPIYANTSSVVYPTTVKTHTKETSAGTPVSLSTLTISTCVPTVIYSTITVTPTVTPTTHVPYSTGTVAATKNGTSVATASPTQFTGAASNVQGSMAIAAAAGLAALVFA